MGDDDDNIYEDPAFYAGINDAIFGLIGGIMGLIQQGEGGNVIISQQPPVDLRPIYIGFGIMGFFMIILLLVMIFKK